jgi:hypothetical protein
MEQSPQKSLASWSQWQLFTAQVKSQCKKLAAEALRQLNSKRAKRQAELARTIDEPGAATKQTSKGASP